MSDDCHVYVVEIKSGRHKGLQAVTHDRDEAMRMCAQACARKLNAVWWDMCSMDGTNASR